MTLVTSRRNDAVCAHSVEWRLMSSLTAMSSGQPTQGLQSDPSEDPETPSDSRERRKLRNEDSSYDSDFDGDSLRDIHEDVSRTASETLGAEFAEYVTLNEKDTTIETITSSPYYTKQVEFGVKLGYSERLVQLALLKLGINPENNKLLDELIRLGAGAPKIEQDAQASQTDDTDDKTTTQLRSIIIDGSNVAMSHGGNVTFSCKGIRLCVDWFKNRGHKHVVVMVPSFRKEASKVGSTITDQEILHDLEKEGILTYTPSRNVAGKRIVPYDDRYILKEAAITNGIVVSNDNYRDLLGEFRKVIEESLLMYSWINGRFAPPDDPLGRSGPSLEMFLKKKTGGAKDAKTCPYLGKCTYGNKCKYAHPERGTGPVKSVTERLQEHAQKHFQNKEKTKSRDPSPGEKLKGKTGQSTNENVKRPLERTRSNAPSNKWNPIKESNVTAKMSAPTIGASNISDISYEPHLNTVIADSLFSPGHKAGYNTWGWGSQSCEVFGSKPGNESDENRHAKLQRQLSINPVHDPRVPRNYEGTKVPTLNLPMFMPEDIRSTHVNNYSRDQLHPLHQPLTRHLSSQESKSPFQVYPYSHTSVFRNVSAPDGVWGDSQRANHHCRLNSTSDSRLNLHACDSLYGDPFEESTQRFQPRPISPHSLQQPNRTVSQSTSLQSSKPYEDERFKIFYHLSQVFPEAQVRAALVGNPQETDPVKICTSILDAAKGSQVRSVSPPKFGTHMPLRGTSSLGTGNVNSQRESARLEAYCELSKMFSEEHVMQVMTTYPEETDIQKLGQLLVMYNRSS